MQGEVRSLRRLGLEIETFSVWRSPDREVLSERDREELARTEALLPPRPTRTLRALFALLARPRGLRVLARAYVLGPPGARRLLLGTSWAIEAAGLWWTLRGRGIRHVHAHLAGTAPAVARLVAELGNATDSTAPWTWSLTVHGPDEFADVFRERLREKVEAATFVVAVSDFARSQLLLRVDERGWHKIHVVHCGVDTSEFAPGPASPAGDELAIVTVGRLAPAKGQAVLVEALRLLAERGVRATATIVGDGPRSVALRELAAAQGVEDRVVFAGAVAHDRIPARLAAADVFCLPSLAEGVPMVLMEAMAMAKPVVTTGVMGIPELVEHGVNGLVVRPGRADDVAAALQRLAVDRDLRRRLGEAARETVERDFDAGAQAAHLRDLFVRYVSGET